MTLFLLPVFHSPVHIEGTLLWSFVVAAYDNFIFIFLCSLSYTIKFLN